MQLEITPKNLNRVVRSVSLLDKSFGDFKPEMKEYRNKFSHRVVRQFMKKGKEFGTPWAPLAASTRRQKPRGTKSKILIETGFMFRFFDYESDKDSFQVTNATPYFKYHQHGTSKMPARVSYRLDRTAKQEFYDVVRKGVIKRIKKSGL